MSDFLSRTAPRAVFERYLTRAEEKRLFAHVARHKGHAAARDHAWMRLMRYTGLRLGSVRGLTVGEARTALRTGQLRASDDHAKGGRGYDVRLNRHAEQAVRDLLKVRKAMGLVEDDDGALVCSRLGRPLSERSYQAQLTAWAVGAGLDPRISPHWLRHTAARRVLESTEHREPLRVLQTVLGHSSISSTSVYALPTKEDVAQAMEDMGR